MVHLRSCYLPLFVAMWCGAVTPAPGGEFSSTSWSDSVRRIDITDRCQVGKEHGIWNNVWIGADGQIGGNENNALYYQLHLPTLDEAELGAHFELRGQYPNARFATFRSKVAGTGGSYIAGRFDYQIDSDPGSINPFRGHPYPEDKKGIDYRLKLAVKPREQAAENELPIGYDPATGAFSAQSEIWARIYRSRVPGDPFGGVPLPRVIYVYDRAKATANTPRTARAVCRLIDNRPAQRFERAFDAVDRVADILAPRIFAAAGRRPLARYHPPERLEWFIANDSNYIESLRRVFFGSDEVVVLEEGGQVQDTELGWFTAYLDPAREGKELVVFRIKAPTSPDDDDIIDRDNAQTRYWSICTMQTLNMVYTYPGCVTDHELVRDEDDPRYVTLVMSTPQNRPAGLCSAFGNGQATSCRFNWIPFPGRLPTVTMRHRLANEALFPQSYRFYKGDLLDSAAIEAHMGDYFPTDAYCSETEFADGSCLAALK